MLAFYIEEGEYFCPETWKDLTIGKAAELKKLTDDLPQSIKDYFHGMIEAEPADRHLSDEDTETLNLFWQRMLTTAAEVPSDIADQIIVEDILGICEDCFLIFVVSFLFFPIYDVQNIKSFEWEEEELFLPESGADIAGVATPLEQITTREFCEAADISAINDLNLAPLFISILCRPKGEIYDETAVKRRTSTMKELTMDVYLEVFFCLLQLTIISQESILSAMKNETKHKVRPKKQK